MAFAFRASGAALLLGAFILVVRAWNAGGVQTALAYNVLVPSRRSRFTTALLVMIVSFFLSGVATATLALNWIPFDRGMPVAGLLALLGAMAAFLLAWIGLGSLPGPRETRLILDAQEPYLAAFGAVDRAQHDAGASPEPPASS